MKTTTSLLKIGFVLILYFYCQRCYCDSSKQMSPSTSSTNRLKTEPTTTAKPSSSSKRPKPTTSVKRTTVSKSTPKRVTTVALTSKSSTLTTRRSSKHRIDAKHLTTTAKPLTTPKPSKPTTTRLSTTVKVKTLKTKPTTTAKPSTSSKPSTVSKRFATSKSPKPTRLRPSSTSKRSSTVSTSRQTSLSTTSSPIRHRRAADPSQVKFPTDPFIGGRAGNPGTILKFNKQLFVTEVDEACRKAESEKRSASDAIVFDLPSGKVVISELLLTSLSLPLAFVDVSPPNLLVWFTDNARLSANGAWIYYPSNEDSLVNHTGKLCLPSTSFTADLNTSMGRSNENQPAISKVDCNIKISCKSNVTYSSPSIQARLAIAEIESNITAMIKKELQSIMCNFTSFVLQSALNDVLSSVRHSPVELWDIPKVSLDYGLIADPYVDPMDFSVNLLLKGSIIVDDKAVDFYPHDMISLANTSKMVTTLFSDFMLNSLLASAYEAGLFSSTNIASTYSSKLAELLSLNCGIDELCVGSVFPYNSSKSGDFAELSVSLNSTPSAVFLESGGFLRANGSFVVSINNSSGKFTHVQSPFSLVASFQPLLRNDTLYFSCDCISSVISPGAGQRCLGGSIEAVDRFVAAIFHAIINEALRHGFPIPIISNNKIIQLGAQEFAFHNRTLSLAQNPV